MLNIFPKTMSKPKKSTRQGSVSISSGDHVQRFTAIQTDINPATGSNRRDYNVRKSENKSKSILRDHSDFHEIKCKLKRTDDKSDELSAAVFRNKVNAIKNRLEQMEVSSTDEKRQCEFNHCLAMSCARLGNHTEAHHHYRAAIPYVLFEPYDLDFDDVDRFCTKLKNNIRRYHIEVLLDYFELTIETFQNLDVAERILGILPWLETVDDDSLSEAETRKVTLLTIQASNARRNFEEAFKHLCKYNAMFGTSIDDVNTGLIALEKAKVYANKESLSFRDPARNAFVYSLTMSTIISGIWHENTLKVLYHFGIALMHWGDQEAACTVLNECCTGSWYRLGSNHPYFVKARRELKKCDGSTSALRALTNFTALEPEERRSVAYEHIFVNTIIDLLWHIPAVDLVLLENAFWPSYDTKPENRLAMCRILARCMEKRGDFQGAWEVLNTYRDDLDSWDLAVVNLDEIRIISQNRGIDAASDEARSLLTRIGAFHAGSKKLKAILRKLVALGVTHFTFQQPSVALKLVEEQDSDILGSGTYALVQSVKVGHELYARKSIALPRFRQRQIREAIQNELSVTRKLVHPHTIRVFFTYEDNARFYIIMEPVADCDLEAFLIQHSSTYITWDQVLMVLKWFCCLASTLAFIHSKGIRHKDIKPHNILIKKADIIFADFGSSHAFLEEGDSTTEGPSYGHTKKYCAPEVINQGKRNRAADIFSLGCVFTELAVWLPGSKGLDIHKWHEFRETKIDNITTDSYHATLDKVEQWFRTCADTDVRTMYNDVIGRMLCTNPYDRPTAAEISRLVIETAKDDDLEDTVCSKCRLDLWLDVPADMAPRHSVVTSAEKTLDYES
jgi:serine/threonine protein kinase